MKDTFEWEHIFQIRNKAFAGEALRVFHFQYQQNGVYHEFVNHLKIKPEEVTALEKIPFLPISFFKTHEVKTTTFEPEVVFESSGTTGQNTSRHLVKHWPLYEQSFLTCFKRFYGAPDNYCILGLLPGYLERENSSLVAMVDTLINDTQDPNSGFYLYDHEKVYQIISHNEIKKKKTILIGVTYALLDFAEKFPMTLKNTIIMETGGMKGKRKEITRQEVHEILTDRLGTEHIHSECGMTELLSQAYSAGEGVFYCPPWMKVSVRDPYDPLRNIPLKNDGYTSGFINIIDLANRYSCSFIATEDLGRVFGDGRFCVMGRGDTSLVRGCNLLVG